VEAIDNYLTWIDYKPNAIYLKGDGRPPCLMKQVVAKYEINLEKMIQQVGISEMCRNTFSQYMLSAMHLNVY